MPKAKTVTERSKKSEILEAYQELQKELEALKKEPGAAMATKAVEAVARIPRPAGQGGGEGGG